MCLKLFPCQLGGSIYKGGSEYTTRRINPGKVYWFEKNLGEDHMVIVMSCVS